MSAFLSYVKVSAPKWERTHIARYPLSAAVIGVMTA